MHKIALLAGPGAGKTTLALALTAALKQDGHKFHHVNEFARDFIDKWTADTMMGMGVWAPYHIALKQARKQNAVPQHADGYVTDSPLFLPWFYALPVPDELVARHTVLEELYSMFLHAMTDYTLVVKVEREKPYLHDGTRYQTEDEARLIDGKVISMVAAHGVPIFTVKGTLDERVTMIRNKIGL